ncbi:DUF2147 domain-containing protein [Mucilaginibacter rigui]|uniref:DUF2147 domain-containing protein n=1 Tax=Mucilaginibacter rigui TaxID=534635 RepID=A0ABR7X160_9SPHI|nr:DUF2147 domain-containing protein [Mucilaginibacter rigui]MBD1384319.1 DUF2147 domain-containing protein [Mucilaginibacter rigui]
MAQTPEADKILGVWLSEDKTGKIDVYKVNGKYFGKLIWGKTIYEADGTTSRKDDYLTCYNAIRHNWRRILDHH